MGPFFLRDCLREFLLPEFCVLCGASRTEAPWYTGSGGDQGPGSRDDSHLCRPCWDEMRRVEPARALLELAPGQRVPVLAAQHTNPDLVKMVGAWKYHGLRGLAGPLLGLLRQGLKSLGWSSPPDLGYVPVPLHGRRLRERGFNQAEVLAHGLARPGAGRLLADRLRRQRRTAQQARQQDLAARQTNLAGAFRVVGSLEGDRRVVLVDDLVTSGATAAAALGALERAGWQGEAVICLGLAAAAETAPEDLPSGDARSPTDTRAGG